MNLMALSWAALMDMQPQRSHQIAWFVYGWIEREHVLNVDASGWVIGGSAQGPFAAHWEHCSAGRAPRFGPRQ